MQWDNYILWRGWGDLKDIVTLLLDQDVEGAAGWKVRRDGSLKF